MSRFCSFHKNLCQENCLKGCGWIKLINEDTQEIITKDVETTQRDKFSHDDLQMTSMSNAKDKKSSQKSSSSFYDNMNHYNLREISTHGSVTECCQSVSPNIIKLCNNSLTGVPAAGNNTPNTEDIIELNHTNVTEKKIEELAKARSNESLNNRLNLHKDYTSRTVSDKAFPTCPTVSSATSSFISTKDCIQNNLPPPIHNRYSNCTKEKTYAQTTIASKNSLNKINLVIDDSCVSQIFPLKKNIDASASSSSCSLHSLKKEQTGCLREESIKNSLVTSENVPPVMKCAKKKSVSSFQSPTGAVFSNHSDSSGVSDPFWKYVEGKIKFINELYTKSQDLTTNESLFQAHDVYVRLLDEINTILSIGSLYVLCLMLPKDYLKNKNSELIYRENIEMPRDLQNLIHSHSSKEDVHLCQPCICSMLIDKNVFVDKICGNLSENSLNVGKRNSREEACKDKSVNITGESEKSIYSFLNNLWNVETQSHPTFQILKEPVLLCPLKSQTLECLASIPSFSANTNKSSSRHNNYEAPCLSMSYNEEDLLSFERKEVRTSMSRQLWMIGEMPAIVYGFSDVDKNAKCWKEKKVATFNCNQAISKSSHLRKNDNPLESSHKEKLELPVDIQIIFISSSIQSKNTYTETLTGANQESVSGTNCASLDITCMQEKDVMLQFHSFLKNLVNNPHFHRLRVQYYQSKKALSVVRSFTKDAKSRSWNSITTKDYSVTWHLTSTGNVICMLDGVLRTPLFQCLSIINETDLHGNWLPFISESVKLHQVSMFTQVIRQKTKLPWPLQDRDAVLVGCAIDGVQLGTPHIIVCDLPCQQRKNCVLSFASLSPCCCKMYGESVPERATSLFNYPLPLPSKETTRMHIDLFTFILKPDVTNPCIANAKLLVLLDSKLLFVPKTLQSFIARTAATKVFINMQRICTNFEHSIYAARVASNKELYDIIRLRLLNYYSSKLNKS